MKNVKKQILRVMAFAMAFCLIAVSFTGCGNNTVTNAYRSVGEVILESQILASNADYELEWDSEAKSVLYKNKNGKYLSDILYESYKDGSVGTNGSSPINITVFNTQTLDWNTYSSASLTESDGNIVCKQIDGGIRVTYFFETYKIAIPVDYVLESDHLNVSIDTSKILEDGIDYQLVSVALGKNICSIKNDTEDAYLVVPTGNGALMSTEESAQGTLSYSAPVYGRDAVMRLPMSRKDEQEIRLPIFGSYGGGSGVLGVIEEGEGSAFITAEAGNKRTGYSSIYTEFYVRGYDEFMYEYYGQNVFKTSKRVNEDISGQTLSVSYYPLYGDNADYAGMAKRYQSYLADKGQLTKTENNASPYSVTFLGGTNTTQSFFGIPYNKVEALTTFSQAQSILEQLKTNTGILPEVRLLGYGDKGIRPGSIAGGSSYLSVYGSKKELKTLEEYCNTEKTGIFLDFDIVKYSKSGYGFSLSYDVAKTAIMYKAVSYPTNPVRKNDTENAFYILGRDNLIKAGTKALKKAKKYSASGVSFSSLGSTAYSDYSDNKYINRNEIEEDAAKILSSAKESGYATAVADANAYAACAADIIFDVTATSGEYNVFSCDIPLYQMVFSSYKPMYSEAVNLSSNVKKSIAKSVAYGMGIGYQITDGYVDKSDDLDEYKLYATIFEDNADDITEALLTDGFIKQYNAVNGSALVDYTILNNDVVKSVFENGVVIYTNLSSKAASSPVGTLKAYEYKLG